MRFVSGLRPSPAIVVACLSLAVSLSGVAYAAVRINTEDIQRGAVTTEARQQGRYRRQARARRRQGRQDPARGGRGEEARSVSAGHRGRWGLGHPLRPDNRSIQPARWPFGGRAGEEGAYFVRVPGLTTPPLSATRSPPSSRSRAWRTWRAARSALKRSTTVEPSKW